MSESEESYSTDVEEFSKSGGMDYSESSRISSNDSDGNEEVGVQLYVYEPETNTEGNANITVLFYEITERVEKEHNKKDLMFLFVLPGYKFRHDVFIDAENHGMFSSREH